MLRLTVHELRQWLDRAETRGYIDGATPVLVVQDKAIAQAASGVPFAGNPQRLYRVHAVMMLGRGPNACVSLIVDEPNV